MIDFLSLHMYIRAGLLLILLLLTTVDLCAFVLMCTKKKAYLRRILFFVFSVVTFSSLTYFSAMQNAVLNSLSFDDYGLSKSVWMVIPVCVINIAYVCWVMVKLMHERKNSITSLSVKESFDNLPTGLCFSRKNGMVQLVNYQMNKLSYLLTGEDIQNAEKFWDLVSEGELDDDVERLASGENPEIRFRDGKVWSFARETIDSVIQITATDITDYCLLTDTLEKKNAELRKMNDRLRKHGENVDEVVRSKERLETKVRIHGEFGQALIATHHALQDENSSLESVSELWKRNIAVLRMEAEPSTGSDHLTNFVRMAESAGVSVEIKGKMPRNKEIRLLIMSAATESLTNAVKHADAKTLFIEIEEMPDSYAAVFTNDGDVPETSIIIEGGGLGSLRRKIERVGGEMYASGKPMFTLTLKLFKESGEKL